MIQQRPNESDEDYKKRKRRVKLTMMGGLAHGGGSIIAAAAIYYQDNGGNFIYTIDGTSNMILDNKGSLGSTNDGLLYSGRGIELGATNDTIVGDAAKWTTWFDFADATHKTVFGVKTFNSITTNSILVSASEPSALTLAKFNNNPNLVGKLALSGTGTIPEVDLTLVAGDEYYMCSEKSGAYLVDSRATIGAELHTVMDTAVSNSDETTTYTKVSETAFNLAVTIVGTSPERPLMTNSNTAFTIGQPVMLSFNAVVNSGTPVISRISIGGVVDTTDIPIVNGFNFIIITPIDTSTLHSIYFDGTNLFDISVTGWSLSEITAEEIANYTDTVRTNADLQQKGIQTTAFVTDGAGVPTSFTSNILNFTSLDYIDTQWNPSLETEFWLEEIIAGVVYQHKYDGTNLTTYTDNVAGTPALHSPENASYLLGKGVYPKVTANPYTSYQAKTFAVYTGSRYTSYDQSARYIILAAL